MKEIIIAGLIVVLIMSTIILPLTSSEHFGKERYMLVQTTCPGDLPNSCFVIIEKNLSSRQQGMDLKYAQSNPDHFILMLHYE